MHTIKCPKCGKTLRMDRPVQNARLKCRSCGEVFVGSSQEVSDTAVKPLRPPTMPATGAIGFADEQGPAAVPLPAAPAVPAPKPVSAIDALRATVGGQQRTYVRAKPKRSVAQAIVAIVGLVVIAGIVVGLVWLLTHKNIVLKDADGRVVFEGWLPKDEAQRRVEEHQKILEGGKPAPTLAPPGRDVQPTGGEPRPTPVEPGLPKYDGDDKIFVEMNKEPVPGIGSNDGFFVGTVRNKYTCPVSELTIAVRYWDPERRAAVVLGEPVKCSNLAPNGVTGFSVAYGGKDVDEARKIPLTIKVTDVRTQEDKVGFDLPKEDFSGSKGEDGKTFTVAGKIKNTTSDRIIQMEVYADFFSDDGLYLGSAKGEIAKGTADLRPREPGKKPDSADFTVNFTVTSTPPSATKLYVRVIASKV